MIYSVSFIGKKHLREQKRRQDRCLKYSDDKCIILVVADGHGGSPYVRSEIGAYIACNVARDELKKPDFGDHTIDMIKERFDKYVNCHLKYKPLSPDEKEKLGELPEPFAYGTTLLAVKITQNDTIVLQIGDGRILAVKPNGELFPDLPDDENNIGSNTSSLVLKNAKRKFRFLQYGEPAACVILYSDGYKPKEDLPWTILESLNPSYQITNLQSEVKKGDKYQDDQTLVLYFDESKVENTSYIEGIEKEKQLYIKKRALEKINEKIQLLESFLSSAMEKYKKLPAIDQEAFKNNSISPRYDDYLNCLQKREMLQSHITDAYKGE